ncbi:hypothetical protein ACF3NR_05390 [Vaginella massiliensis]|uniref:hypothetical protein n=1 Tax=Vaginella massiliensis TaxID=1816680 RepID=UPI0037510BC4
MNTIKVFHPEETFIYHIDKTLCKVVFQGNRTCLLVELHSNDDLEHVEADSLQNDFPQLSLFIDDFPIDVSSTEDLNGKQISIPFGFEEIEDEEGEVQEVYYTSLNAAEEEYEMVKNELNFEKNQEGTLQLKWIGYVQDFTEQTDDDLKFEVNATFNDFEFNDDDFE